MGGGEGVCEREREKGAAAEAKTSTEPYYMSWYLVLEFIPKYSLSVRAPKSFRNDIQWNEKALPRKSMVLHLIVHRLFIHSHSLANAHFQWSKFYCKLESKREFEIEYTHTHAHS